MPRKSLTPITKSVVDKLEPGCFAWDSVERGFGVRAYPSGAKSFVFQYRMPDGSAQGKMTIGSYPGWTVEEARREAGKLRESLKTKMHGPKAVNPSKARRERREAPTVADLAEYYLGTYATSKGLRDATVRDARDVLRYALPSLGRIKVADVTPADVRKARAKVKADAVAAVHKETMARRKAVGAAAEAVAETERALAMAEAEGRKIKRLLLVLEGPEIDPENQPGVRRGGLRSRLEEAARLAVKAEELARSGRAGVHQANRLVAVLRTMFTLARTDWGVRSDNPCDGAPRDYEEQRERNLSEPEVHRLLEACATYEVDSGMAADARGGADAIRLLLFTGARLQEVLKAEWREFDLERGLWTKPSSHTKTKRLHRVELDGPALDLLMAMHTRRTHARFLFPGEPSKGRGTGTVAEVKPRVGLKRPWAQVVKSAGLDDVRLHDLRRTLASFMLSDGASLATVGKALGHTQPSTTARYAHLSSTVQRSAIGSAGRRMIAAQAGTARGEVVAVHKRRGI